MGLSLVFSVAATGVNYDDVVYSPLNDNERTIRDAREIAENIRDGYNETADSQRRAQDYLRDDDILAGRQQSAAIIQERVRLAEKFENWANNRSFGIAYSGPTIR